MNEEILKQFKLIQDQITAMGEQLKNLSKLSDTVDSLSAQVDELKKNPEISNDLMDAGLIPHKVEQSFRERLGTPESQIVKLSSSENRSVNEGGSGSYNVLNAPIGFLRCRIGKDLLYIPYYI